LFEKDLVDQLLVIPAGVPLLRENAPIATGQQRRTMCQLALADLPAEIASKVQVNPIEILRTGPSYAIDTVEAVAQNYPDDTIVLVIGQDAAEKLNQWHRIDELREMVEFLIIARPGFTGDGVDIGALNVAATTIRQGLSADVSSSVAAFIRENNLYDN
jgi:nicotinate-nucleotide adenylyltransferase